MVLPDGTGSADNRPRTGRASLFAVAALVMVVGFIALGSLSPSGPAAIEATTTTSSTSTTISEIDPPVDPEDFAVAQIATGEALEWQAVQVSDTHHPMEIVDRHGRLYLFTTSVPWWTGGPGGLTVWQSTDGQSWRSTGQAIPDDFRVTAVASSPKGFVAAGAMPGGQSLFVWTSEDGIAWTATEIPTDARNPYQTPMATAVGATGDRIVVAAQIEVDQESIVEDHLTEIGIHVDLSDAAWATRYSGDNGLELSVYGPLATPAVTVQVDELDVTEQERRWLTSSPEGAGQASIWVVDDKGRVNASTIPLTRVTEIVGRGTGGLLALGQGGAGAPTGFTSGDGIEWKAIANSPTPLGAVNKESFLVGFADVLRPELLYSMLGGTWMEMGVDEIFPPSAASWSAVAFGGGDHGVALAIEGREAPAPSSTSARGETTLRSAEGAILTLDYENERFVLREGATTHTWMMQLYPTEAPGGLEVDLEEKVIVFRDPHDDERLATFTFEELQRADTRYRSARFSETLPARHHALVLNTGALDWDIKDLGPVVGVGQIVRLVAVGSDRVVAVVDEAVFADENPPGFEIWSAPTP